MTISAVRDDGGGSGHRAVNRGAVVGVAAVAAVASYEHAFDLVQAHGEVGWTARLVPLTVDGLIYASSMVMLDSARRRCLSWRSRDGCSASCGRMGNGLDGCLRSGAA